MAATASCVLEHHQSSCSSPSVQLRASQGTEFGKDCSGLINTQRLVVHQNASHSKPRRLSTGKDRERCQRRPTRLLCTTSSLQTTSRSSHNLERVCRSHSGCRIVPSILNKSRSSSIAITQFHSFSSLRSARSLRCNASVSLGFPLASDVDTWRLIIERVSVIIAILVAQLAGSSKPVWRLGLPNRVPLNPSNLSPSGDETLLSHHSRLSFASAADWAGPWTGEWDGATSADSPTSADNATSARERRATGESASTSDAEVPFPPRIWGDISDKLKPPLVARRGRQVETLLAKSPELSVQGLAREPRRQLFSAALRSLRRGVESLPDSGGGEWEKACEGVLVDAVSRTKSEWLGEIDGATVVSSRVGMSETTVSQPVRLEESSTAVQSKPSAGSNWMQNVFGLGGTKAETPLGTEGGERISSGEPEASVSQELEPGRRFEFGGWAAPAFRTDDGTDSKRRELPVELALMEEKLPLYEELLFYLRFKTCRPDTRLPENAFARFAPRALEDLVLAIADAVASDCMSQVGYNPQKPVNSLTKEVNLSQNGVIAATDENAVDEFSDTKGVDDSGVRMEAVRLAREGRGLGGQTRNSAQQDRGFAGDENGLGGQTQKLAEQGVGLASDENGLAEQARQLERLMQRYLHPRLRSTRALERFRNEVSIRRFIRTGFSSVAAMYEDRYELYGLRRQPIAGSSEPLEVPQTEPGKQKTAKPFPSFAGLGFLGRKRQAEKAEEDWEVVVVGQRMPCRRIAELRRLAGWQLRYSMALEFLDVAAPVLNALLAKLGDWISFLLVRMIGRSLGLVYKGIKQSLKRP